MDIVDQILQKIESLKDPYYENMFYFRDEDDETEIKLGTKLLILGMSIKDYAELDIFNLDDLKLALDMIEDFVKDADEETQGMVEVMFLESLHWWAEDKEWEASKKYGDYLLSCLGPTCRALCKRNDKAWKEFNIKRQQEIDEKYAEMQREYDERKAAEKKEKKNWLFDKIIKK
jgi:hypothetical protein